MAAQTFNMALEAHVKGKIQTRINELGRTISAGAMPSFEQYKYHCGTIKGLQEALDLIAASAQELLSGQRGDQNGD